MHGSSKPTTSLRSQHCSWIDPPKLARASARPLFPSAHQANVANRKSFSLEAQALLARGAVSEAALLDLTRQATALRALLRVKISDDADLDTAAAAVAELRAFLAALDSRARARQLSPFDLLAKLA